MTRGCSFEQPLCYSIPLFCKAGEKDSFNSMIYGFKPLFCLEIYKMKTIITLLLASATLFSCNSNSASKETGNGKTDPVSNEKKVVRLEPSAIDVNKPIDAIEANFQIDCWDGKKIEVAGYGYVFYGDSLDTKSGVVLTDSMGGTKKLVDCSFAIPPAQLKIAKTDMIHIRGKIRGNFLGVITMDSCEIVAVAKTIPAEAADPFSKRVNDARSLLADYFKWDGKEIAVIGDYYMTTTSTTSYGKTIRVDLKNAATNDKVVGCDFKEDPTDKIRVNEKGVIIKGKVKTYTPYGYTMLEECSLVNR